MRNTQTKRGIQHRTRILKLRAEGNSLKEIAAAMDLSLKCVEYHWRSIRRNLGLHDVALVVQYALKCGIARWKV